MFLDHSPVSKLQLHSKLALDPSPNLSELDRYITNYLIACQVESKSVRTLENYSRKLRQFSKFLNQAGLPHKLDAITASHVRLFLLSLQGLNPSTINSYYRAMGTFFNWLVLESALSKTPMVNMKPPRIPKANPKPLSKGDIERIFLLTNGSSFLEVRNRAMVLILLDTGLRLFELASIQLSDINIDQGTIRVMGKGAKERTVKMGKQTQKALLRYVMARKDDYDCLWVTEERRPMTLNGVKVTLKHLCARAQITDCKRGAHAFRHTAAIHFLRNGGGEFLLQMMLGHSTLQMTRRYVSSLGTEDLMKVHIKASPVDNMLTSI